MLEIHLRNVVDVVVFQKLIVYKARWDKHILNVKIVDMKQMLT